MLHVASVRVGDKYSREYVAILFDMVRRHLATDFRFWCLTDDPKPICDEIGVIAADPRLVGWWAKVQLFSPDMPWAKGERVAYFDLDSAIIGRLEELVETRGIIRDWNLPCYNSSVMVWDAGEHADIWSAFSPQITLGANEAGNFLLPGDQDWITALDALPDDCAHPRPKWDLLPRAWCVSYRAHASEFPPAGAKVVCFHGEPKPHDCDGWVKEVWKLGGLAELPTVSNMNVSFAHALANVELNSKRNVPWFVGSEPHADTLVVVGGAPSLKDGVQAIKDHRKRGAKLLALNNACAFLNVHNIVPDCLMICDAREENVVFTRAEAKRYLIASQCDPGVFEALKDRDVHLIQLAICDEMRDLMAPYEETHPICMVGGGSTVGLRAIFVAILSGYKKIHIYGMDGSYNEGQHHAYDQPQNDTDNAVDVYVPALEKYYVVAPWMGRQANEYRDICWPTLKANGVKTWVHGSGLIPDMHKALERG